MVFGRDAFERVVGAVRRVEDVRIVVLSDSRALSSPDAVGNHESPEPASDAEPNRGAPIIDLGARIAAELGIHAIGGPSVEFAEGRRHIAARVWDPSGDVLGVQRQTHLSRSERESGYARGDEISVFDIEGTAVGVAVGSDLRYPEVGRIMALQGVELVAAVGTTGYPSGDAVPSRRNHQAVGGHAAASHSEALRWSAIDSLWAQVQQNQFWAVSTGACSVVLAPCEITAGMCGYLSWGGAANADRPSVAVGDLDRGARDRLVASYPLLDLLNPEAYRFYLPALYTGESAKDSG